LQATKNSDRLKYFVSQAVGSFYLPDKEPVVAEKSESAAPLDYQALVKMWWGTDPFQCSKCGSMMELVRIWKPNKGVVFSAFSQLFGADIGPPGLLPDFLL
jgi:hypothetical protein